MRRVPAAGVKVAKTPLAGRKVFVYAGNMGVAQGMGICLTWPNACVRGGCRLSVRRPRQRCVKRLAQMPSAWPG
jgi:hypothetical protein